MAMVAEQIVPRNDAGMASDVGEECDDGNNSIGDGCRPDCTQERCGDTIVDPGEACDDGNDDDTDGCKNEIVPQTPAAMER